MGAADLSRHPPTANRSPRRAQLSSCELSRHLHKGMTALLCTSWAATDLNRLRCNYKQHYKFSAWFRLGYNLQWKWYVQGKLKVLSSERALLLVWVVCYWMFVWVMDSIKARIRQTLPSRIVHTGSYCTESIPNFKFQAMQNYYYMKSLQSHQINGRDRSNNHHLQKRWISSECRKNLFWKSFYEAKTF